MGIQAKNMDFKKKHMGAHMEKKVSWPETLPLHFLCLYVWYCFPSTEEGCPPTESKVRDSPANFPQCCTVTIFTHVFIP